MKNRFVLLLVVCIISVCDTYAQNDALLTGNSSEFKRLNAQGLAFRVQVGAYSRLIEDMDAFFGISGILPYDMGDGIIRYVTTYNYGDIESAELEKEEIIAKGVLDAFIVPFWGNERISEQKAIEILENIQSTVK
jgi:hypothetical protein